MSAGTDEGLAARIEDLEARLAFQEQAIEQLSDTVYRQEQELTALKRRVKTLSERTSEMAERLADAPDGHEPPPHY
ncbi:MAG: SlyX family protein [Xanthomonadales bacterium]|nr:SlyX family protein [Xanthomonadales bacterium]